MIYDVAVIGAGPAGTSAALHAAKAGLRTLLVEEHRSVGSPVHCGECLSRAAVQRMGWTLPDDVVGMPVKGIRVLFPQQHSTLVSESGFVLEKERFEAWIASQAVQASAELRVNTLVVDAKREGDAKTGTWKIQTNNEVVESKILVDATGVKAFLSAKLGLNTRFSSVIGVQYELQDIPNTGYLDFYLWPDLAPSGYLWMIPKKNGRANVGLVTNQNTKAKLFLDAFLQRQGWSNKKNNPRNPATPTTAFGGLIPASGPLANTTADGLMLVGDAAGFTSPLFEGGTQLSLVSGRFAAQTAAEALAAGDASKGGLQKYVERWRSEFPDYNQILSGKHKLYALSEKELVDLASTLPADLGSLSTLDKLVIGIKLALRNPALYGKGIISALQAFGYSRAEKYGW